MDPVTHIVNGVRTVTVDGAPRFTIQDVATILGRNAITVIADIPDEYEAKAPVSGWTNASNSTRPMWTVDERGLFFLVDAVARSADSTTRESWVCSWAIDLAYRACHIAGLPHSVHEFPLDPLADDLHRAWAGDEPACEPEREPGENPDCPCWVVRSVRDSIHHAVDGIEDATRFLDGYVSGLKLYGADTTTRYHFEDLLTELSVAQDRLERAADDLACAGLEEGDDDDE